MDENETTTVVIVGAGPSGLMLGCNLTRYGIDVILLDYRPDKTSTGKADGMQPKTIETFKQLRLADDLLRTGVRVYDIAFWESTENTPLHRTGRQTHYPDHLVGASDPYILLAHQGIIEDILIGDIEERGVSVRRRSRFVSCERLSTGQVRVEYQSGSETRSILSDYLVGCDGARSVVRDFIPNAHLEGDVTNASWGVLDGVIETNFPDLWSKVAVRSHSAGSILWIPRERNMTRLYVQLSSTDGEKVDKRMATPEYVMHRAVEAMRPFNLRWKTIEWFGNYVVGQRAARHFADDENRVFIAGDAGHCHSALAAQGANTSMHDSFNLAWKINLVVRGLANRRILRTYEDERRKIAKDLISFDAKHCEAFAQGDDALARNFDENIRFISGVGAEYSPGPLTLETQVVSGLRPGALMVPARVVRYIDANPVDIQIDIPLLGQFRVYLFVPDVRTGIGFLQTVCEKVDSGLKELNGLAQQSYQKRPRGWAKKDELLQPQRYTSVSHFLTFALVTRSSRSLFEVVDLPDVLQKSRWTLYLDELDNPTCTEKWMGDVKSSQAGIAIVRPDGYAGGMGCWTVEQGEQAAQWTQDYFQICRCI